MTVEPNAFLIRPNMSLWYAIKAHLAQDFDTFDYEHQLYVPGKFLLGTFKQRKHGFKLCEDRITYVDSPQALASCQEHIDKAELVSSQSLFVPHSMLEVFMHQGTIYADAKKRIAEPFHHFRPYFTARFDE